MFLTLLLLTLIAGLGLLLLNLRQAPEGYQDETGFHFKDKAAQPVYAHYDAFAGQEPKRYALKVDGSRVAA